MKRIVFLLVIFTHIHVFISAQQVQSSTYLENDSTHTLLYQYYFGHLDSLNVSHQPMRYIIPNPYYYKLFTPLAFYHAPVKQFNKMLWVFEPLKKNENPNMELLAYNKEMFSYLEKVDEQVNRVLIATYLKHPELIVTTEDRLKSVKVLNVVVADKTPSKSTLRALFKPDPNDYQTVGEADMIIRKPNFWTKGGEGSLQLTQNYISDNWYKGGESTFALQSNLSLYANYNDKEKVQFENLMEVRLGMTTAQSDTIHKYKMNTDLFRLSSKLGIQAASKWYYTLSGEFNTQFFRNYNANSAEPKSAFLAPANLIFSLGMDYKNKGETYNLSAVFSPLAYNLRYVGNKDVDETSFGLDEGRKFLNTFGSKVQCNLTWTVFPSITWTSRIYYFTSYEKVEAEWENTFNFVLNRYLSTKLFVHTRFDDSVARVEGNDYFQWNELLSFGINYKW